MIAVWQCQVMHLLRVLSETTSQSITEIMEPHKDILNEMIPPKKHLLRYQPANAQIGLMVCTLLYASCVILYSRWPRVCHNNGSCAGSCMLHGLLSCK